MISLTLHLPNRQVIPMDWDRPVLSLGRSQSNDVIFAADNVSGQHAQICSDGGRYIFRDLRSTNGSILIRKSRKFLLKNETLEMKLEVGDRVCLASPENNFVITAIHNEPAAEEEGFENTILAQENAAPGELEDTLGSDHDALRSAVRLARELSDLESLREIAELTAHSCLRAFPRAQRVLFLVPDGEGFRVEYACNESGTANRNSTITQSKTLLNRCLSEHKGFLFLFEQNKMRAVATMASAPESLNTLNFEKDRVILCCPLFQGERCYGFIEVEAPLGTKERESLTRRDLSLATLMGHLVSSRIRDLESQQARIKLARKATAGFLSATVGHCFKNLLFVPMSISKMLPLCLSQGKMEDVQWMLARNTVNIRYLDILSNEFAAASKDPNTGFDDVEIEPLLREIEELVGQIAPDQVEARLAIQDKLPKITCHGAALRRLLMNLTLNAFDAFFGVKAEKGLIELRAEFCGGTDELCLTVQDHGPGIPEPILVNLREIFKQVQLSTDALSELQNIAERVQSTKDQGFKEHYGLGFLFVCQTVHQHQGRLEIESEPGQGARFQIFIPRQHTRSVSGTLCLE